MNHLNTPLTIGVIGLLLGVAGVLLSEPWLGGGAGLAALVAGALCTTVTRSAGAATPSAGELQLESDLDAARVRIEDLEGEVDALTESAQAGCTHVEKTAALTDEGSGLFSETYFHVALESRLASARRHLRPVAVTLMRAAEGSPGDTVVAPPPERLADAIFETIREADIACRLEDGTFAVVLEDTPENGAVWTTERIRRNLVSRHGPHTVWAGIACYPAHAFSSSELYHQASAALASAQDWRQDRIEVAISE